jgi:hypothetical protein
MARTLNRAAFKETDMTEYIDMFCIPHDHPLRNKPLAKIGAQTRWKKTKADTGWKTIKHHWRISSCHYNDLGPAWITHSDWRVPVDDDEG